MKDLSSQAVEAGTLEEPSPEQVGASARARRVWPQRMSRGWRHALLRRLLAYADLVAALLAIFSFVVVGSGDSAQLAWSLVHLPVWILVAKLLGLYDRDGRVLRHLTVDEAPRLMLWALIGTSSLSVFLELTPAGRPDASSAVLAGVIATVSVFVLRAVARWLWRTVTPPERVALIGTDETRGAVKRKLEFFPDLHMTIAEEYSDVAGDGSLASGWPVSVERVIFAPAEFVERQILTVLAHARGSRTNLTVVPPCEGIFGSAVAFGHVGELPVLEYKTRDLSRSTLFVKRVVDVAVSSVALVLLLPVFTVIAVAIMLDTGRPVFFSQQRAGLRGKPFRLLKFRSMTRDAEARLESLVSLDELIELRLKLPDDPRVTWVGRFLRRWSLDELPQLVNVLRGEMSLVGPRPEQLPVVERYGPEHRVRLETRPGITGPMQVFGRGDTSWEERLILERDYVENLSIARDLQILLLTAGVVIGRRGAY